MITFSFSTQTNVLRHAIQRCCSSTVHSLLSTSPCEKFIFFHASQINYFEVLLIDHYLSQNTDTCIMTSKIDIPTHSLKKKLTKYYYYIYTTVVYTPRSTNFLIIKFVNSEDGVRIKYCVHPM